MKVELEETPMAIMTRFYNGLNREIQDVVEMYIMKLWKNLFTKQLKSKKNLFAFSEFFVITF